MGFSKQPLQQPPLFKTPFRIGFKASCLRAHNPEVAGSNPVPATKTRRLVETRVFFRCKGRLLRSRRSQVSSALRASGALRLQILSPQPKQEDSWKRESFFVKGKATSSKPEVAGVLAASRLRKKEKPPNFFREPTKKCAYLSCPTGSPVVYPLFENCLDRLSPTGFFWRGSLPGLTLSSGTSTSTAFGSPHRQHHRCFRYELPINSVTSSKVFGSAGNRCSTRREARVIS